jgi:hypothetical protein
VVEVEQLLQEEQEVDLMVLVKVEQEEQEHLI